MRFDSRHGARAGPLQEARGQVLDLEVVLERAVVPAGEHASGAWARRAALVQLLADRVGHPLVAAGVQQQQRGPRSRAAPPTAARSSVPSHWTVALGVHLEVHQVARARSRAPAAPAGRGRWRPPRRSRARRPRPGWPGSRPCSSRAARPGGRARTARRTWPARRRPRRARSGRRSARGPRASKASAARPRVAAHAAEVEVALLGRPGAVQDHHAARRPGPRAGTARRRARRARPARAVRAGRGASYSRTL